MSQFIFGDIILPNGVDRLPSCISTIPGYPFSFRFNIQPGDFYRQITSLETAIVPFIISDSINDNTAELLLQHWCEHRDAGTLPECYTKLLSTSLKERINLVVSALQDALAYFHASECLLVFCDGYEVSINWKECHISYLAEEVLRLVQSPSPFIVSSFRITGGHGTS